MAKKKALKSVSLVALSAVMVSGIALTAAGCGGSKHDAATITVYIFCNDADKFTNDSIAQNWAREYSAKIDREVKVNLRVDNDKDNYFTDLNRALNGGLDKVEDVIYLSPKFVQSYANPVFGKPTVMDLSPYIDAEAAANISGVWSNAISYYGYDTSDDNYTFGQQIEYKNDGFYVKGTSQKVGLYGLPKDYSNFSMGYNKKYFTSELKKRYETTKGSTTRTVTNKSQIAGKDGCTSTYTGYTGAANNVATFAASGEYTLSDGTKAQAVAGQEAPIIAIGVPVTYKPFNFYRYNDYTQAKNAGDPMATMVEKLTNGSGYTVTLPGFPGDTFEIADAAQKAQNVPYDSGIGHTVFTYAEYGALNWALTYYLNTFDWDAENPNAGAGGLASGQVIYGSEQYETAQGNPLYLLPWLASNDADFINASSTSCVNAGTSTNKSTNSYERGGTTTEDRTKINLDGTTRTAKVQYGMDSKNFMETYTAFEDFGALWNGNSGNAGDEANVKNISGWDYFRQGATIFYGAGTWDAATRNETKMDVFEFGQMPAPISEKLALYSETNNPSYDAGLFGAAQVYSNAATAKGTGNGANDDYAQRTNLAEGKKVYSQAEIIANQTKRQDKWAARMDSVGYAANARLAELSADSDEAWKKAGAASLIQALTIGKNEQVTLTYAGAQLPNFQSQCTEFLKYQDATYRTTGAFKDMITPDGFADTTDATTGRAIWDYYYQVACAMATDSLGGSKSGLTVSEWVAQSGYGDYNGTANGDASKALRYDPQYADTKLSSFTSSSGNTNIAFSMKVFRMVCFTYADRDLNIRMQYGLNSVRDSSMYTQDLAWLGSFSAGSEPKMLAYRNAKPLTPEEVSGLSASGIAKVEEGFGQKTWFSPATFCIYYAQQSQKALGGTN